MLGKRIAYRLKELGLTQKQLADRSDLTQPAVNKYIRGKAKPSYETIEILSDVLKVHPGWFFPGRGPYQEVASDQLDLPWLPRKSIPSVISADVVSFPLKGKILRGATFVIGHYLPMQHLPPPSQAHYAGIVNNFYALIFSPLAGRLPTEKPRGVLAIDWKPVGDSWMFRLRGGVRFHDGTPLTVEDVKWSYEQYLNATPQEPRIQGVEIVDSSVVQIFLKSPCDLEALAMPPIMPTGMKESQDQWVGTGPFRPIRLSPGFWRLRSNPYYFFGQPFFGEIHIREYSDPQALEEALTLGEVHFAIGIQPELEDFVVKAEPAARRYHLHFLLNEPLAANPLLRKAIDFGLDRQALAKAAGLKRPLFSAGPFDYILSDRSPQPALPFHPELARELLKPIKNLKDSVFRIQYYRQRYHPLAEAIVQQLKDLGIPAQIGGGPPHALLVIRNAQTFGQEYRLWESTSPPEYNPSGYSNPEVDRLIQQCISSEATSFDLQQLRQLIQKDLPDIPLFYDEMPVTYVKQLRALENRIILLSSLSEIQNWFFDENVADRKKRKEGTFG